MRKLLFVIHPLPQGDLTKTPGIYLMQAEVVHHLRVVKFCSIRGHWLLIFFPPQDTGQYFIGQHHGKEDHETSEDLHWVQEPQIPHYLESVWSKISLYFHLFYPVHVTLSDQFGLSQSSSVLG